MKIAGRTTRIERLDETPGLRFRVRTEYHWVSRTLFSILIFSCVVISLSGPLGKTAACCLAILTAAAIHRMMQSAVTDLRITPTTLFATGNLGGSGTGHLRLRLSDLQELHYAPAGAGQSEGLYAREGTWCSRCVLPRLTEVQANAIVAEIALRHPQLLSADLSIVPTLLGGMSTEAQMGQPRWRPFWNHPHNTAILGTSRGH